MSKLAVAFLESLETRIPAPATPKKPGIPGVGEMPRERSAETRSEPIVLGRMIIVRSMYWKRIHFCNINCGNPCKVTWRYRRGISVAELNEVSAKIGADLKYIGLPGISAEIGSKISSTVTRSDDQEISTEFTTTAPKNGGLTHARWQLVDRYSLSWSVKKWWSSKVEVRSDFIEGNVDAFDESLLFYFRHDCPRGEGESDSWLEKLKRGLQPFLIQEGGSAVVVPGKPNPNGSVSLEGFSGTYNVNDVIPRDAVMRYLNHINCSDMSWVKKQLRLAVYEGSFESFMRTINRQPPASWKATPLIALGAGVVTGVILGVLYAPRSGRETREAIRRTAQEGAEYIKRQGLETREGMGQWVDRGKEVINRQKEQLMSALKAARRADREASGEGPKKD